jgi:DNA-binding transcriptional LysR family regulator
MNYTLHQLKVFLTIVESESISKAAQLLFLSQPAVSIQLKNLQEQFDIPLTELVGRRIFITDFGREIAAAAASILSEVERINHKTLAYQGKLAGKIKISVVSTGKYVIPYFLSGFLKQHSGLDIQVDVTNRQKVLGNLEKNEIDLALVSVLPDVLPVERLVLMPQLLYLFGKAGIACNVQQKKGSFDWKNNPLIFREKGSGTRYLMEKYLVEHKVDYFQKLELSSNEAVKQAVLAGIGYSVLPHVSLKYELNAGDLEIIPLPDFPIISEWQLIWLRGRKMMPATEALIDYLRSNAPAIVQEHFNWLPRLS